MFRKKLITFTVPIEKELTRTDEIEKKLEKMYLTYYNLLIAQGLWQASSLSNLVNNISEGIRKIKCKFGHDDKKCEACEITYEVCYCFLECTALKMI